LPFPLKPTLIDAQGNTIMPGIINAHVHDAASPLVRQFYFLQRGVTSVCDVGSSLTALTRAREPSSFKITARGFFSGPIINAPNGYPGAPELLYAVTNPREARLAVSDLVRRGADYIKIALEPWNWKLPWPIAERDAIPNLSLAELQAIVDQAHQEGKLVRAHLGTAEMLDLALESGVDALEHVPLPRLEDIDFRTNSPDYADLSAAYEAQLARIVQHNVIMTPTLDKIISWCESYAVREERKILCRKYALTPVYRFHQMGGIVALGDDSASDSRTWMPIQEMRRLLEAGLTPMEVIQAGTLYAARVCGHRDELGTLTPGKLADVIIVEGNPLKNIDAMNNVRVVIINVRGKTYAIDGSGLGKRWRIVGILNVNPERALWVTWRVLSGNASEKGKEAAVVHEMVDEVREVGGADAIEWLLMDALYADGPLLAWLKYQRNLDALVRLPEDRELYADLEGLIRLQPKRWQTHTDVRYLAGRRQTRDVSAAAEGNLTSWDSFVQATQAAGVPDAKLWGCLLHAVDRDTGAVEDWALVSTRTFSTAWQGYTFWRQRWHIENNGFREFKEGWHVEQAPWTRDDDVVAWARVTFTCIAFNVAQIAKTAGGRRLTHLGIRRLRRELTRQIGPAPVIVFAQECYGIFNIEEIVTALGAPPAISLRRSYRNELASHRAPPESSTH
jgi:imidazolonepropionase-like amidohydrolase